MHKWTAALVGLLFSITLYAQGPSKEGPSALTDLFYKAETYRITGRYELAKDAYEALLAEDPTSETGLYQLGRILFAQQDYVGAAALLTQGTELYPENEWMLRLQAQNARQMGDFSGALVAFNRLLVLRPSLPEYKQDALQAAVEARDYRRAYALMEQIEAEVGVMPETVQQKVEILLLEERILAAEKLLKQAKKSHPEREEYVGLLGQFYDQIGAGSKARRVLVKAGKNFPESAPIALETARVLQKYGRGEQSLKYLEKSMTLPGLSLVDKGPVLISLFENAQTNYRLLPLSDRCWEATRTLHEGEPALYLIEADRAAKEEYYGSSVAFYQKAIEGGYSSVEVYLQALTVCKLGGLEHQQLALMEDAYSLYGTDQQVVKFLLIEYYQMSQWERCAHLASEHVDEVLDPDEQKIYLDLGAHAFFAMDSVQQGSAMYERSLGIKEEPNTLNNYAWELGKRGLRLEYALELVTKSNAMHSLDPTVIDTWAWILYKMERYEEAQAKMAVALSLLRTQPDANYFRHAAAIEKALGNEEKWAEYRQKAKEVQGK